MSSRNPTGWMWAQACDLLDEAERMHRRFFQLGASDLARAVWGPPVNVFEDEREIIIVVALPGVPAGSVEATIESGTLVVRAESRISLAGSRGAVRRLEIPYGVFERRIELPDVRLEAGRREFRDGCLILRLRKAGQL